MTRRYTITVGESAYLIDVDELSAGTFRVRVGADEGQEYDVRLDDASGTEVAPRPGTSPGAPTPASKPAPAADTTPRHPPVDAAEALIMTAPMPGTVLSVDVSVGQTVTRGDILLVFEAMKMKNALHASRGGRIAQILVAPGDQVQHGQALVRFDT